MAYILEYIGATWCKSCHVVKPDVTVLATKYGISMVCYDYDTDTDTLDMEAVKKLPTLRVKKDGVQVAEFTANHCKNLDAFLASALKTTDLDF